MNHFILKLNKNLDNQLQIIDIEEPNLIIKSQKSIRCVKNILSQLKILF